MHPSPLPTRVVLALPAYNEEEALPQLFEAFQRETVRSGLRSCVVVDDGSRDGTDELLRT